MNYQPGYFDREHYLNHSKSPLKDSIYTLDDNVPLSRNEPSYAMDEPIYHGGQYLKHNNIAETNVATLNNNFTTTATSTSQAKSPNPSLDKTSPAANTTVSSTVSRSKTTDQRSNGHRTSSPRSRSPTVCDEPNNSRMQYESLADNITSQINTEHSNTKLPQGAVKIEHEDNTGSPQMNQDDGSGSSGVKMAEDAPKFNSPPVQNSKTKPDNTKVKKEVKDDDSNMYSFLDWKDGIATLPGKAMID